MVVILTVYSRQTVLIRATLHRGSAPAFTQ